MIMTLESVYSPVVPLYFVIIIGKDERVTGNDEDHGGKS